MFALINTMNAVSDDSIGTVMSRHRTADAALRANDKLQLRLSPDYVPTRIVRVTGHAIVGLCIANGAWEPVEA